MPRRILVVSRHFWPEYTRLNELCSKLAAFGFKIDVLCGQPSRDSGEFYEGYNSFKVRREVHDKLNVYRTVDVKKGTDSNISIFLNYITFPLMSFFVTRKLQEHHYDAVFVYQLSPVMTCAPGMRIAKKQKIPVYVYVAELWPQRVYSQLDVQSTLFRKFLMSLSMHYYRKASRLIVPTQAMKKYFADRLGSLDEELALVPLTPDPWYEEDVVDESLMEKLAGSFHLLITGDPEGELSVKTVIKIAHMIREGKARNIRFVVTGTEHRIKDLEQKVQQEGLSDYFYFEGKVGSEDLGRYLHIADIMLYIVKPEKENEYAIPVQVVNMIAAGKPVVASLSGYVRDAIREAGCGMTTEPEDSTGLYQAIMTIYQMSPEERKEMGKKARKCQEQFFNREEHAESIAWILAGENVPGIRTGNEDEPGTSSIRKL